MRRDVHCHLTLDADGDARGYLAIAVARGWQVDESLAITLDGAALEPQEIVDAHGTRLHAFDAKAGRIEVTYRATVTGEPEPATASALDEVQYLRPSRYCESDTLGPVALAEAGGREGHDLVRHIARWVGEQLTYVSGSSRPIDGAVATMLARQGVCRDFAHLVVALLRALDVPARVAAVYAPGLSPMDFHAVAEALVDGQWWVVDATGLAPRPSLVRIATGRDAADTAFLTTVGAPVSLVSMEVGAVAERLPTDEPDALMSLP
ncbi:transglutaminase family protein [Demequina sp. NBRC 110055]|uniref:transglutaminase-like domain-containing protein n=1 Tax=Demequina sp. NBRC 110055 TaxID=1570344 RepID=UPI000A0752FC|nr:transglutaminase family protein [Demequina sp. NBRC 110055]